MNNYEIGMIGEEAVALYLERIGCRIVDRNYRTRRGEVDIIFVENEFLVFGEVKTRNSTYFGNPAQAVICLAKNYLSSKGSLDCPVRFDVFEVYFKEKKIKHIRNAYTIGGNI